MQAPYSDHEAEFDEQDPAHLTDSEYDFDSQHYRNGAMAANGGRRDSASSSVQSYPMVRSHAGSVSAFSDRNWGSGIFIVSKSGPSWISDRSPGLAPPNVFQSPAPSYPTISQNNEARSHRSLQASSQVESRESLLQDTRHSIEDNRSDAMSIGKITNWLESQDGHVDAPSLSPNSATWRAWNDQHAQQHLQDGEQPFGERPSPQRRVTAPGRPGLPLHHVNSDNGHFDASRDILLQHQSPLSIFAAGPNSRPQRRVSGPRPQRRHSQATRVHAYSESEGSCSEKAYSEPGTTLPTQFQAENSRTYGNPSLRSESESAGASAQPHRVSQDEDRVSMLAHMGSMSSMEGLTEHDEEEDDIAEARKASRLSGISDGDEEDEGRFWQGSNRNSSVCTPLPSASFLEQSRNTPLRRDDDPDLPAETVLWSMDRRHSSQPAKSLVLPQVASVANRLHANAWRRSTQPAPLLGRGPHSDDGRAAAHPRSRSSQLYTPRFEQIRSSRNFSSTEDSASRDQTTDSHNGDGDHKSTESEYDGSSGSDSEDLSQQTPTVQLAKRAAISRTDALLLISTSPSSIRRWPTTPATPAPKTYAEVGVQVQVQRFGLEDSQPYDSYGHTHWNDDQGTVATSVTRRSKRPDLRIDTRTTARPGARTMQSSSNTSTVCCPRCGHDFPTPIDATQARPGLTTGSGRSLAQARVQARAAAIASISRQSSATSLKTASQADAAKPPAPPLPPLAAAIAAAKGASAHDDHHQNRESDEEQLSDMRYGRRAPIDAEQDRHLRRSLSQSGSARYSAQGSSHSLRQQGAPVGAFPVKQRGTRSHEKRPSLQDVLVSFHENDQSPRESSWNRGSEESRGKEAAQGSPGMETQRSLRLHTVEPLQDTDLSPRPLSAHRAYPLSPAHSRPSTGNSLASSFSMAPSHSHAGTFSSGYPSGPTATSRRTAITPPSTSAGGSSIRHSGRMRGHSPRGSLSEIAPFAAPSSKAMKLLGITDGEAQKPLPQFTDLSSTYQSRDHKWRGSSSSLSSLISMTGSGILQNTGALKRFSVSRSQSSNFAPHVGESTKADSGPDHRLAASTRGWRGSRSQVDVSAHLSPTAPSRDPIANQAPNTAGQTEEAVPAKLTRKLKHALRKGKGKERGDSADHDDHEDPGISVPLSVSHTAGAGMGLGLLGLGNQTLPLARQGDKAAAASRASPGAVGERPKWAPSPDTETFPSLPETKKSRSRNSRNLLSLGGVPEMSQPPVKKASDYGQSPSAPSSSSKAKGKNKRGGSPPTAPPSIPLPTSPPRRWALPSLDLADAARLDLRPPRRRPNTSDSTTRPDSRLTADSEDFSWFADAYERGPI